MAVFKRLSVAAAVFFILTAFVMQAFAGKLYDSTNALDDALQNYSGYYQGRYNFNGDSIRYTPDAVLSGLTDDSGYSYGVIVYGQPHGDKDPKSGQYRYIGYTFYGEDYTNISFPPDSHAGGADFASRNWVRQPWDDPGVNASTQNLAKFNAVGLPGDGDPKYRDAIYWGLLATSFLQNNGYTFDPASKPELWQNIEQYVHILAPPTKYAWGIGRMWHYRDGGLWYITVPLMPDVLVPEFINLKVTSITLSQNSGEPGQEVTAVITVLNESEKGFTNVDVLWRVRHADDETVLAEGTVTADFAPGETKQFTVRFTPDRGGTYSLAAMINPYGTNPPNEINFLSGDWPGDNRMEVSYTAEEPCTDISVQLGVSSPGIESGGSVEIMVFVNRADDGPARAVPVNVTLYSDYGGSYSQTIYLNRGEQKTVEKRYQLGGDGDVTFTAEAWPDGIEDCRPGNNSSSESVYVEEPFEVPDVDPAKDKIFVRLIS